MTYLVGSEESNSLITYRLYYLDVVFKVSYTWINSQDNLFKMMSFANATYVESIYYTHLTALDPEH